MQTIQQLLLALTPGIVIGFVLAILSYSLGLKRYHSEKWWEKKAEVYSKIMESLYDMIIHTERQMQDPSLKTNDSEKIEAELTSRSKIASDQINRITVIGDFIISEVSANRLVELRKALANAANYESWYEYLEAEYSALDKCIRDMRTFAKNDLGVK